MYVCTWKRRVLKEHVSLALIKAYIHTVIKKRKMQNTYAHFMIGGRCHGPIKFLQRN